MLRKKYEKYITFLVLIEKKPGNVKKIIRIHRIKFINIFRFLNYSLSNLVVNLAEGLYKDKCKDCFEHITVKDKCLRCNKICKD